MKKKKKKKFRSYHDVIRDNYSFLPQSDVEESVEETKNERWEKDFTKQFEDSLFREYALVDLSKYEEKKIGMKWRTKEDVLSQKGEGKFCGEVCCTNEGLITTETFFQYVEKREVKRALVKLFLCENCFEKLCKAKKKPESVKREQSEEKQMLPPKRKISEVEENNPVFELEKDDHPIKKKRKID